MPIDLPQNDQESSQEKSLITEPTPPIGSDEFDDPKEELVAPRLIYRDVDQKDLHCITHVYRGVGSFDYPTGDSMGGYIWIAPASVEILYTSFVAFNKATSGSASTLILYRKLSSDTSGSFGTALCTFNLRGTTSTNQTFDKSNLSQTVRILDAGDRLTLEATGTPSGANGIVLTIWYRFINQGDYRYING